MVSASILVDKISRTYRKPRKGWFHRAPPGELTALAGISLEVRPGELFGLLGPNGAGKTTLIKILTTLLAPSSGQAWVDGLDVVRQAHDLRPRINMVSGGESSGYGILTVRENLWLFSRIYGVPNALIRERVDRMLAIVGLEDKANSRISHLSTGQRQKMNFARGFVTDPKILFLDEPTLGLDVTAARGIRSFLKRWVLENPERTLMLTTHYMAEADELCDRLAIIDGGRVLACDTPANLKKRVQEHVSFELMLTGPRVNLARVAGVHQATITETSTNFELKLLLDEESAIGGVVQAVLEQGGHIQSLRKTEPTLEDVFIGMVGHGLSNNEANG